MNEGEFQKPTIFTQYSIQPKIFITFGQKLENVRPELWIYLYTPIFELGRIDLTCSRTLSTVLNETCDLKLWEQHPLRSF